MRISDFYRIGQCEKLAKIENVIHEENRYLAFSKAVDVFCKNIANHSALESFEKEIRQNYDRAWFPFSWQYEEAVKSDCFLMNRFKKWLGEVKVIATDVEISVKDSALDLSDRIPLIVLFPNGRYSAIYIFNKVADKSLNGKSVHTAAATDLHALAAKYALEGKYPNMLVNLVYLKNVQDTEDSFLPSFDLSGTKKSNVFTLDFAGYYKDSIFQRQLFLEVMHSVCEEKPKKDCFSCYAKSLCRINSLDHTILQHAEESTEKSYVMPEFTALQKKVIQHVNGPMLVCAGPGSGKTATLVGRVQQMIQQGIPAEFILLITFTNEAASELAQRCRSFCNEDAMPKISTINSLGYEILRSNQETLGREVNLLTRMVQIEIIQNLVSVFPKLTGFNYPAHEENYELYKTIATKLGKYLSAESREAFFFKEKQLGTDFVAFAEQYRAIVSNRGYIDFDEQVSLCLKLFREHPEVLSVYQNLYQYVMVDEFQDINADNASFIYQIAAHGNLVVVGDDDQGIYGFRGGSNQYMLSFSDTFPDTQTIVLEENFRSVESLVNAAQKLISNNQVRIPKNIVSMREGMEKPILMPDMSNESIQHAVAEAVSSGYSYNDIAILSTKNAPLEKLHKTLQLPTVLAKAYVREDTFFCILHDVLLLHENPYDDKLFFHYMQCMEEELSPIKGLSLFEASLKNNGYKSLDEAVGNSSLAILNDLFHLLNATNSAYAFIENAAYVLRMEGTASMLAVTDIAEKNHLRTVRELKDFMSYMIRFEDDTRMDVNQQERILLITSHESKGREFPIVLLMNDFSDKSEESRRLFYVAMTRAKDRLYILPEHSGKDSFLSEMPDMERRVV